VPEQLGTQAIALLAYLLPGFLAAMVFYGFTSHPKPSQFERVVQALVLTFVVQASTLLVRWPLEWIGSFWPLREWDKTSDALVSVVLAIALGAALAHFANTDKAYAWLRRRGLTSRTSHPSEWYCVFSQKVMFVILHMNDERRLYGWPKEWPIEPDKGQFYIMLPCWIQPNEEQIDLPQLDGILIQARDVKWVEFVPDIRGIQ